MTLSDLFTKERAALDHFFTHVDLKAAQTFVDTCLATKGLLVFSGVGKSGLVAEKIAATLTSTGTKALFLPPAHFLHGDLGILSAEDLCIMISKSGETEELLHLIPFIKKRKTPLLALTSQPQSRLAHTADFHLHLPLLKELCPFDLAPTTSTVLQLIFGDILAVALMQAKGFTLSQYALNHPSGSIGKKTACVEEVMLQGSKLPLCRPSDALSDVLVELSDKRCGCLVVTDEALRLLGIFTDGDLRRALQAHGPSVLSHTMDRLMTPSAITVSKNMLAWDALKIMQKDPKRWIMVTPVVEEGRVVGLLRLHDVIH